MWPILIYTAPFLCLINIYIHIKNKCLFWQNKYKSFKSINQNKCNFSKKFYNNNYCDSLNMNLSYSIMISKEKQYNKINNETNQHRSHGSHVTD